jgi:dihydrofolate reductase
MLASCSVFIAASLDGFIARRNGDLDWLTGASEASSPEDYGYRAFFDSVDAIVLGRNTYETALGFKEWPYAGRKVVVLSSKSPRIAANLAGKVQIWSRSPAELVQRLSEDGLRHIYVDGARTIQGFLNAGLIQEMTITRIPVLIGEGIPLFAEVERDIKFRHVETKIYPNGFVQSKYRALPAP